MAYATVDELTVYLPQLRATLDGEDEDAAAALTSDLEDVLDRATGAVNLYLEVSTDLEPGEAATLTLYGDGGLYLTSTTPMSTVTLVAAPSGHSVPDYVLLDGMLRITDSTGTLLYPSYTGLGYPSWGYGGGWTRGVPYSVTATFGPNADDMAHLTQATLERAVQIWRYKDSGGSETIGAEGAIITVRTGWTPATKDGLDAIKRRLRGNSVGVW
jgi:hypothetical protein